MGRLTWKNPDGTWGLNNMDIKEVPSKLYGAVCKLKDYEETGLMPEQIVEMDELYAEKCKEVAKLQKELEASRERQKAFCEPEYLGENIFIGCRNGKCSCGNIVRSYQNYCDSCGIKLEWGNVWKQAKEKKGGKADED